MSEERTHEYTHGLHGWITHTELASHDPVATRDWCAGVLGWDFQPAFPSPSGDYHLFAYSEQGGGGVRQTASGEAPGSTPTVHVDDTDKVYQAALAAGAAPVAQPHDIMPGVRIALVRAPGGVLLGLSGPTA
jgi:predicted enzyme related to lactoylglutathione lyase